MRTPGTWEAVGNFVRTTRDRNGVGGYEVAECPIGAGNGHDDAHLIAAAPDMYEALKKLLADAEHVRDVALREVGIGMVNELALESARAAPARAEGKS